MPTYQYVCTSCQRPLEMQQTFTDPALTQCPVCAGQLRKVFSAVGVVFKGSGFYRNDSRSSSPEAGAESGAGSGADAGKDSGKESDKSTKSDQQSDTKSDAKSDRAKSGSASSSSSSADKPKRTADSAA